MKSKTTVKDEKITTQTEKKIVDLSKRNFISQFCYRIISCAPFNILITLLIVLNAYFLADYTYDESSEYTELKEKFDRFFVAMFTVEFVLKIVGFGPRNFVKDQMNIFDAIIVFISVLEVILSFFVN